MPELHCETITFPSSDGRHTSSAVLYTMPGKPVRAVLQLSHGMCEYVRRYAPMAEFYAARKAGQVTVSIDDDGTLYCREDCNQDVTQPKLQHAEAQKVVGSGAAQG